jgi:hypothetical protein
MVEMLADPDMLTVQQLAKRIGISLNEVEELEQQHRVLAVSLLGEIRYPAFQVGPAGMHLPCLDLIAARLNGSPFLVYQFLISGAHDGTDRRLHELLTAGEIQEVLGEAEAWESGAFS